MIDVAFVTYAKVPDLTPDDQLVVAELKRRSISSRAVSWDDETVDWKSFNAVILRSVWDYWTRYAAFLNWLDRLEQMNLSIWNPVKAIRWNIDKSYLRDLANKGVASVPMVVVPQGATRSLEGVVRDHGWAKAVVKPVVASAGYETWMTDPQLAREDQSAFEGLLRKSGVMIQPFMPEIVQHGEWSVMFFDRKYSHAVIKRPRPGDFRVQPNYGGTSTTEKPPHALIDQASAVLKHVEGPLLYARVDGFFADGRLTLTELELIGPVLFFGNDPLADERFADAVEIRLSV